MDASSEVASPDAPPHGRRIPVGTPPPKQPFAPGPNAFAQRQALEQQAPQVPELQDNAIHQQFHNVHANNYAIALTQPYGSSFWQNQDERSAFWNRLERERLQFRPNTFETPNRNVRHAASKSEDHKLKLAPSPNPNVQRTHRSAIETKREQRLLELIRNNGATSPSTQIATIHKRAGPRAPLTIDTGKAGGKRTTTEPASPKKTFLNRLGLGGGTPSLPPDPSSWSYALEPTKVDIVPNGAIPPKAAKVLGTSPRLPFSRRTSASTPKSIGKQQNVLGNGNEQEKHLRATNKTLARASSDGSPRNLKFYDDTVPPTPPSKGGRHANTLPNRNPCPSPPRSPPRVSPTTPITQFSSPPLTNTISMSVMESKDADLDTDAIGRQDSSTKKQRARSHHLRPELVETSPNIRSMYGEVGHIGDASPHSTDFWEGLGVQLDQKNQGTGYSPSLYQDWVLNEGLPNSASGLYPVPLQVPHQLCRDVSNSTSTSVPLFLDRSNGVNASPDSAQQAGSPFAVSDDVPGEMNDMHLSDPQNATLIHNIHTSIDNHFAALDTTLDSRLALIGITSFHELKDIQTTICNLQTTTTDLQKSQQTITAALATLQNSVTALIDQVKHITNILSNPAPRTNPTNNNQEAALEADILHDMISPTTRSRPFPKFHPTSSPTHQQTYHAPAMQLRHRHDDGGAPALAHQAYFAGLGQLQRQVPPDLGSHPYYRHTG